MEKENEDKPTINIRDVNLTTTTITPTSADSSIPTTSTTFLAASKNCTNLTADLNAVNASTDDDTALIKTLTTYSNKDDNNTSSDSASPRSEFESSTQHLLTENPDVKEADMKQLSLRDCTIDELIIAHLEQTSTAAHAMVSTHMNGLNESGVNSGGVGVDEITAGGVASVTGDAKSSTNNNERQDLPKRDDREGRTTNSEATCYGESPELGELDNDSTPTASIRSIGSFVCRICHNAENPERLVSPCLCKGSLTYVHIQCLERWISTSRNTTCELCQFQYNTEQTLRYTCLQSLRMWYSRSMSRRALQEDCQMFSLLTLVAFGIIGTLLVGIQYYYLQGRSWGLGRLWTKGWLVFFLFSTMTVYFINIYMIVRSQLAPWYRWWQSARDIKLILENRKPFRFRPTRRLQNLQLTEATSSSALSVFPPAHLQQQQQQPQQQQPFQQQNQQQQPCAFQSAAIVPPPATPNGTTTMLSPQFSESMSLHLQFNRNVAMAVAAAAAIAEFDGYNDNSNIIINNNFNNNSYNNINNNNININKHCADFAPPSTIASVEMANAATAGVTGVPAAVEIPLDVVAYELATAL